MIRHAETTVEKKSGERDVLATMNLGIYRGESNAVLPGNNGDVNLTPLSFILLGRAVMSNGGDFEDDNRAKLLKVATLFVEAGNLKTSLTSNNLLTWKGNLSAEKDYLDTMESSGLLKPGTKGIRQQGRIMDTFSDILAPISELESGVVRELINFMKEDGTVPKRLESQYNLLIANVHNIHQSLVTMLPVIDQAIEEMKTTTVDLVHVE
jgi:hypothetical protein